MLAIVLRIFERKETHASHGWDSPEAGDAVKGNRREPRSVVHTENTIRRERL
jgi:hypothetical protein